MIRGFGLAFAVFLAVTAVGVGAIWMTTRDSSALSSTVLNQAQTAMSAAAALATQAAQALPGDAPGQGEVLDSPDSGGPATASPVSEQIETFRVQARNDMIKWFGLTMSGGLAAAFLWLGFTHRKSGDVHGPQGARSMGGLWWGGFLFCGASGAGAAFYMLKSQGLGAIISATMVNIGFLLCFLLVALAYYLGTMLGAPAVMRPSVPGATLVYR